MAVAHADRSHTGKQVQISSAVHVPQPLHVSLVDEHRLLVVGDFHGHGVTVLPADLHHPLLGHSLTTTMNRGNNKMKIMFSSLYFKRQCKSRELTLYSSGVKLHGGISGMSPEGDLNATF